MQQENKEPGKYDDTTVGALPKHLKDEISDKLDIKKLEAQYLEELKANQQVQEYLKEYHETSIKSFLETYAHRKSMYVFWGRKHKDFRERSASRFYDEAYDCFWSIQQKKLFNLQCQWRADQITLEGIEISADFDILEFEIERVPFLEPVSEEDMDLYLQFLETIDEGNEFDDYAEWQDYDQFKDELENDEEGSTYPDWYDFYDMRRGTSSFLSLPDIRGKKEEFYRHLYFEEQKRIAIENGTYKEPTPYVPYHPVPYSNEFLRAFIKKFEKPEFQDYLFHYIKEDEKEYLDEQYEDAVMILDDAEEDVPIEYNDNWKKGVIAASKRYRNEELKKNIVQVFRDYQFRMSTGIQHPKTNEGENHRIEYSKRIKDQIIKGRILNGEPGDLNF
ncbi:MAG: hypothetical protein HY960_15785 [Ignavibacteriae bacterium]|nr:hypothetical protein [Ignavibacteriota bacterium]